MVARGVLDTLGERKAWRKGRAWCACIVLEPGDCRAESRQAHYEKNSEPPTRLTLITQRAKLSARQRRNKKLQLFLFTPGTSLKLGAATGIKAERRLLLACLYRWRRRKVGAKIDDWIEFFRCGAGQRSEEARKDWAKSCIQRATPRGCSDARERPLRQAD